LGVALDRYDEAASRRLGINRSDLRALLLMEDGPVTAGHLAEALELATGSVAALIKRLVDADLVHREHDRSDRRVIKVSLRPAAYRVLAGSYSPAGQAVTSLGRSLGDEHDAIVWAIEELADRLERAREGDVT
jgi:DNA-binding MarR family transcriptional regulator